jgi:hypothetical protein
MRRAFVGVSIAVFLLFVGVNVYRILYPGPWGIECNRRDSSGRITSTVRAHITNQRSLELFLAEATKRGEVCEKFPE